MNLSVSGLKSVMLQREPMADTRLWWESITPLGLPVEPLVYMMMAMSSGPGGLDFLVTAFSTSPLATTSLNLMHFTPSGHFLVSMGFPVYMMMAMSSGPGGLDF